MTIYQRFWHLIQPYRTNIGLSILFNVLMVVFSLVSITSLIPILTIIFEDSAEKVEMMDWNGIMNLRAWLENRLNVAICFWQNELGASGLLARVLILGGLLMLLKNIFRYLAVFSLIPFQNGVERDIRNQLHAKYVELSPAFYANRKKGDLLSRITTDVQEVQYALKSSVQRLVRDPLMIILTFSTLILLSPQLTLFALVALPIAGFVINSISRKLKAPAREARKSIGSLLSTVEEQLNGIIPIQSLNGEGEAKRIFSETNQRYYQQMNKMMRLSELSSPTSETLGSLVIIGTIWFGGNLIFQNKGLEPAVFITYIALFYQIINPAKSISTALYDIRRGQASYDRIATILKEEDPISDPVDALPMPQTGLSIQFDNVSFKYETIYALRQISFSAKAGETIALVGTSGSGKSTIAKLLSRFYEPNEGDIRINGIGLDRFRKMDLRAQIGLVTQEPYLFHATLEENLKLGENYSEEALWEALRLASAEEFVKNLPKGIKTIVGDRGLKLSGGQRQRIALARVLLRDTPIIVLDEATSALDSENEGSIQSAFAKLGQNKTAIIIAHRLSTIQNADKIIVLQDGELMEQGKHEELISRKGRYYDLFRLQAK